MNSDVLLIKQARFDSNQCIARKDVAGVSKYWIKDFVQIAGDGSFTKGKTNIAAEWKYMFSKSSPVFERLPDVVTVSASGTQAWEQGTWNYKNDKYHGNYAAMWRKVNGSWFTQSELYVSLNELIRSIDPQYQLSFCFACFLLRVCFSNLRKIIDGNVWLDDALLEKFCQDLHVFPA